MMIDKALSRLALTRLLPPTRTRRRGRRLVLLHLPPLDRELQPVLLHIQPESEMM
jgi:hypothetical protein